MSSRVQKGSTVFRPVVKSRSKTAPAVSRQQSIAVEQPTGQNDVPTPNAHPASSQHDAQSPPVSQVILAEDRPDALHTISEEVLSASRTHAVPPPKGSVIGVPTRPVQLPSTPPVIAPSSSQAINTLRAPVNLSVVSPPVVSTASGSDSVPEASSSSTSQVATTATSSSGATENSRPAMALTDSNSAIISSSEPSSSQGDPKAATGKRGSDESTQKSKRRRTISTDAEGTENVPETVGSKRSRSRTSSATPRPRRRAPSPPPYDPDADPGEELDPTAVTMAALCSDTGQGRVSRKAVEILNNHAAWKAKNREKRARMKMLMEAKKYGREEDEEGDRNEEESELQPSENTPGPSTSSTAPLADKTGSGFDYSQDLATSRFNVQVRIGPNGETVIDEESLVVDRAENDGTENYTHVVESDLTKFVNSGSYSKRYRGSRWTAEETELFYDALAQYGENYELIALMLPGRDRKSCKNKFKVEDKKNPARINHCLNNSIPVDMKTLSRLTGKDFSGPVPEIRAPLPPPIPIPNEENSVDVDETPSQPVKKRSRSSSRSVKESGVVVVGDAENFES